jgi:hypothetical protein
MELHGLMKTTQYMKFRSSKAVRALGAQLGSGLLVLGVIAWVTKTLYGWVPRECWTVCGEALTVCVVPYIYDNSHFACVFHADGTTKETWLPLSRPDAPGCVLWTAGRPSPGFGPKRTMAVRLER